MTLTAHLAQYSEPPRHYTTKDGRRIALKAVPVLIGQHIAARVRAEYAMRGEPIEPPKYRVETAGGGEVWFSHVVNEKGNSLDVKGDPEQTARNWAMWNAYQDALRRMNDDINEQTMQAMLFLGIECEQPSEEWVKLMRFVGADIPDDPMEQRMRYIVLELLKDPEDYMGCVLAIQRLSGMITEQQVLEAVDSFRRSMGRAAGAEVERITAKEGQVVDR